MGTSKNSHTSQGNLDAHILSCEANLEDILYVSTSDKLCGQISMRVHKVPLV